jgi:hypothetical protein
MNINRTTLRDRCRMANAGIDKHLANEPAIALGSAPQSPADIKKHLQASIDAADATQNARAQWVDASGAEVALRDDNVALLAALRSYVLLKFGKADTATLADFGFSVRKRTPSTVETKAAAAEKSRATRTARHTMGPRQKEKVKGTVAPTPPVPEAPTAEQPASPGSTAGAPTPGAAGGGTAPHGT